MRMFIRLASVSIAQAWTGTEGTGRYMGLWKLLILWIMHTCYNSCQNPNKLQMIFTACLVVRSCGTLEIHADRCKTPT